MVKRSKEPGSVLKSPPPTQPEFPPPGPSGNARLRPRAGVRPRAPRTPSPQRGDIPQAPPSSPVNTVNPVNTVQGARGVLEEEEDLYRLVHHHSRQRPRREQALVLAVDHPVLVHVAQWEKMGGKNRPS